jgi:lysophospholipase L1-like esterase
MRRLTAVADLRSDGARWLAATWRPLGAFCAAMGALAVIADRHERWLVTVVALALVAASSWLNDAVGRARRDVSYAVARGRLVVTSAQLAIALVAVSASRAGVLPEAMGFTAIGLVVIALGAYVSEARRTRWGEHVRGPVLLWISFVGVAASLTFLSPTRSIAALAWWAVVAELGTELRSEDRLREPPWDGRVVSALGALMLLVAVMLLVAGGSGTLGAAIVVAVVLAVVWMASSDSDALLLVLVVAAALVWASAPRGVAPNERLTPHDDDEYFVVLGDSYTSGEGAGRFFEGTNTIDDNANHTNECRRAPSAWPVRLATDPPPGVPAHVLFLACSGARTEHIRATPDVDADGTQRGPAELVELAEMRQSLHLSRPPAFVLLGVGGNDAGFGTIGPTCVGPGDCAELADRFLDELRGVEAQLDLTYRDVRAAVGPNVPVIVHPYPVPITDSGQCSDVLLDTDERALVVRFVEQLDLVVRSAAARAGFLYLDTVESALTDTKSRLCDGPGAAGINLLGWNPKAGSLWDSLDPRNWLHNSLHPNERGHEAIEQAVQRWLATHALVDPAPSGAAPRVVPDASALSAPGTLELCAPVDGHTCDIDNDGWLAEQLRRLLIADLLPVVLAAAGAWLLITTAIRWAAEHEVTSANLFRRALAWARHRFARV